MIRVQAAQGGVVEAILAQEGDMVRAGQPLATLRLSSDLDDGDAYVALSRTMQEQDSAESTRSGAVRAILLQEQEEVIRRRASLITEVAENESRLALQLQRVELAEAEVERASSIADRGYLPRREVDLRRSAALAEEQAASQLRSSLVSLQRTLSEASARLRTIPLDLQAADAAQVTARAAGEQRRIDAETKSSYVSTSPIDGIVNALPARVGQTLQSGGAVALVRRRGSRLEAELYAPSRAAGFLRAGQKVRLMYQGFPYQKFGAAPGHIASVSQTALTSADIAFPGTLPSEPLFRIQVALERETVSAYHDEVRLQPGMLLSAEIIVDQRSLLEWLLDPLYAANRR